MQFLPIFYKKIIYFTFYLMLFFGVFFQKIYAQEKIYVIDSAKKDYILNKSTYYLQDSLKKNKVQDFLQKDFWQKMQIANFGYHKYHAHKQWHWYKITITNQNKSQTDFVYEPSLLSEIYHYVYKNNVLIDTLKSGKGLPASSRSWSIHPIAVFLKIPYQDTITIITKAITYESGFSSKDIYLGTPKVYYDNYINPYENPFQFFFQGAVWVMFLSNIFFFFIVKDKAYLYYALYMGCMGILFLNSHLTIYYFPEFPNVQKYGQLPTLVVTVFYTQFLYYFLSFKDFYPDSARYYKYWLRGRLISIIFIYLMFVYDEQMRVIVENNMRVASIIFYIPNIILVSDIFVGLYIIIKIWKKNIFLVSFMFLGYLCVCLPIFMILTSRFTEIPIRGEYIEIGALIELILFSVGLGYRSKVNEKERLEAKENLLLQSQENQRLVEEQNAMLEEMVEERTSELNQQHKAIEEQNKNIMENIHYARNIQEAFLPKDNFIKTLLPKYFIYFNPRDVVSGDFYFVEEIDDKIIVAVVDCTGHGVSGAFMTMLANNILHNIVSNQGISEANIILNELHKNIRIALKQENTNNRDGMDLSLLVIDHKNKKIQFAGAKNTLVYIQNNQCYTIKADKMPIGGEQLEEKRIFSKHEIILDNTTSTMFYLFSDGYQDQFGGENNKKFGVQKLKDLFLEIHKKDMNTQKNILAQNFKNWSEAGKEEQLDDVLVLGLEI